MGYFRLPRWNTWGFLGSIILMFVFVGLLIISQHCDKEILQMVLYVLLGITAVVFVVSLYHKFFKK